MKARCPECGRNVHIWPRMNNWANINTFPAHWTAPGSMVWCEAGGWLVEDEDVAA